MIKYLGSKRLLVPAIRAAVRQLPGVRTAADLFSGTTRVARGLKEEGLFVFANDSASYSEVLARCYIETDARSVDPARIERLLRGLQSLSPREGYFTETFCERSRYFHPKNGARIDAIREGIARLEADRSTEGILLASLLEAADRVDSTTGLQMAYLKQWAPRALEDLHLRLPQLLPGNGAASGMDAVEFANALEPVDLAYVDPPYNQHSFFANYHVWETLIRNDRPEVYGVACKRVDCRQRRSPFNSRKTFRSALEGLLGAVRSRYLILSCSSEGFLNPADAPGLLARWGEVGSLEIDFKRYVGAQIGIHNPQGEKVGTVSHLRNREHLFIAGPEMGPIRAAADAARAALDSGSATPVQAGRSKRARRSGLPGEGGRDGGGDRKRVSA